MNERLMYGAIFLIASALFVIGIHLDGDHLKSTTKQEMINKIYDSHNLNFQIKQVTDEYEETQCVSDSDNLYLQIKNTIKKYEENNRLQCFVDSEK